MRAKKYDRDIDESIRDFLLQADYIRVSQINFLLSSRLCG